MTVEVDPNETGRASAYKLWMQAPNPMVTFLKTLDVTNLVRLSRKRNLKYNMLMDYCTGKAASDVEEFYTLPVGEKLIRYDSIAVNTIITCCQYHYKKYKQPAEFLRSCYFGRLGCIQ